MHIEIDIDNFLVMFCMGIAGNFLVDAFDLGILGFLGIEDSGEMVGRGMVGGIGRLVSLMFTIISSLIG